MDDCRGHKTGDGPRSSALSGTDAQRLPWPHPRASIFNKSHAASGHRQNARCPLQRSSHGRSSAASTSPAQSTASHRAPSSITSHSSGVFVATKRSRREFEDGQGRAQVDGTVQAQVDGEAQVQVDEEAQLGHDHSTESVNDRVLLWHRSQPGPHPRVPSVHTSYIRTPTDESNSHGSPPPHTPHWRNSPQPALHQPMQNPSAPQSVDQSSSNGSVAAVQDPPLRLSPGIAPHTPMTRGGAENMLDIWCRENTSGPYGLHYPSPVQLSAFADLLGNHTAHILNHVQRWRFVQESQMHGRGHLHSEPNNFIRVEHRDREDFIKTREECGNTNCTAIRRGRGKDYRCLWCDACFDDFNGWINHLRIKEPDKLFRCPKQGCGKVEPAHHFNDHTKNTCEIQARQSQCQLQYDPHFEDRCPFRFCRQLYAGKLSQAWEALHRHIFDDHLAHDQQLPIRPRRTEETGIHAGAASSSRQPGQGGSGAGRSGFTDNSGPNHSGAHGCGSSSSFSAHAVQYRSEIGVKDHCRRGRSLGGAMSSGRGLYQEPTLTQNTSSNRHQQKASAADHTCGGVERDAVDTAQQALCTFVTAKPPTLGPCDDPEFKATSTDTGWVVKLPLRPFSSKSRTLSSECPSITPRWQPQVGGSFHKTLAFFDKVTVQQAASTDGASDDTASALAS